MDVGGRVKYAWKLCAGWQRIPTTMASIFRRPELSKYWYAAFRDANGRQRQQATKETDREKALRIAKHFELVSKRTRTVNHIREITENLIKEFYGIEQARSATVRQCALDWLALKKAEVSTTTFNARQKSVGKLLAFLGDLAEHDIRFIDRKTITAFRKRVAGNVSARTTNFDMQAVKALFKYARCEGFLSSDPTEGVGALRLDAREVVRRPFTMEELKAILAIADREWQSIIRFGLYTGQRLGDIAALKWANIDLVRNEIRIETRKTHRALRVPIAAPLRTHILSLPSADNSREAVHPRAYEAVTSGRKNTDRLSKQFVKLLVRAGLRDGDGQFAGELPGARRRLRELSFHCLRHNAVSLLKEAGVPHAVVQELIGHDSEAVSAQYTHVGDEALQRAVAALPEI
jgi:integrase